MNSVSEIYRNGRADKLERDKIEEWRSGQSTRRGARDSRYRSGRESDRSTRAVGIVASGKDAGRDEGTVKHKMRREGEDEGERQYIESIYPDEHLDRNPSTGLENRAPHIENKTAHAESVPDFENPMGDNGNSPARPNLRPAPGTTSYAPDHFKFGDPDKGRLSIPDRPRASDSFQ